jgi:hypothetical protein
MRERSYRGFGPLQSPAIDEKIAEPGWMLYGNKWYIQKLI